MGLLGLGKELLTGANCAPTPQVNSQPPGPVVAKQWQAPDVSKSGHLVVHRDHLTTASDVLKQHLPDLRSAISEIQQHYGSFDCLSSWPQGQQMMQNLMSALDTFAEVGQQTHDAHAQAASNLTASANAYQDAETTNTSAAKAVGTSGAPQTSSHSGQWS